MAWSFGDGLDLYTAAADATGYWDLVTGTPGIQAGRFLGSRSFQMASTASSFTKSSGVNGDAVHHITIAFIQTSALTGANIGVYLQLLDGVTGQCAICFRQDGTILLNSGSAAGAILATYPNAFLQNVWYGFEFEVVINNATGSFTVRKNGNTSADFTQSGLITRPTSPNNYANKLIIGCNTSTPIANIDDIFWRSDISTVGWMGDMRCYTRMPGSDISTQFAKSANNQFAQSSNLTTGTGALPAHNIRASSVTCPANGTLVSLSFNFSAGITGHAQMALYDNTGPSGGAGSLLATSAEVTNPGAGVITFVVTGGPTVTRSTIYWVALWSDVSITGISVSGGVGTDIVSMTYTTSSFPSTMGGFVTQTIAGIGSNGMNVTPLNSSLAGEPQQDGVTTYVADNTVGHTDLYGLGSLNTPQPASVVAVTTRGYFAKSDAGARSASVQIKSGTMTVSSPSLFLSSSFQWAWRTDFTDPNTSATWMPANVNAVQIGPIVVS